MPKRIDADGHSWRVTNFEDDRRRAVSTVVFHCLSNSQRPYRVVEVPDELWPEGGLDSLSTTDLVDMFNRSHAMDYSHDASAQALHRGYGDPPDV